MRWLNTAEVRGRARPGRLHNTQEHKRLVHPAHIRRTFSGPLQRPPPTPAACHRAMGYPEQLALIQFTRRLRLWTADPARTPPPPPSLSSPHLSPGPTSRVALPGDISLVADTSLGHMVSTSGVVMATRVG